MINNFSKQEIIVTSIILVLIVTVSLFNFRNSLMRARDVTRRDDLGAISNALGQFYEDFGYFPPGQDGKIKYCKADNFDKVLKDVQDDEVFDRNKFFEGLRGCEWGEDSFDDLLDDDYGPYIEKLPVDPKASEGLSYLYLSNGKRFQLYAHLEEGEDAQGYDTGIVDRQLLCGDKTCSFGKSFARTPLNISIEQYEEELERERLENTD